MKLHYITLRLFTPNSQTGTVVLWAFLVMTDVLTDLVTGMTDAVQWFEEDWVEAD